MNPRSHPLWRVAQQPWLVVVGLVLLLTTVNAGLALAASGRKEMRDAAEVMQLEVCPWSAADALGRWSSAQVLTQVEEAMWWDYAFIAGYVTAFSIACLAFARRGGWYERWGARFGWLTLLAGILDALENVGMLQMIGRAKMGVAAGDWPWITAAFAWPKWVVVIGITGFLAAALVSAVREETGASLPAARPS